MAEQLGGSRGRNDNLGGSNALNRPRKLGGPITLHQCTHMPNPCLLHAAAVQHTALPLRWHSHCACTLYITQACATPPYPHAHTLAIPAHAQHSHSSMHTSHAIMHASVAACALQYTPPPRTHAHSLHRPLRSRSTSSRHPEEGWRHSRLHAWGGGRGCSPPLHSTRFTRWSLWGRGCCGSDGHAP